jgi:hypothetical protein
MFKFHYTILPESWGQENQEMMKEHLKNLQKHQLADFAFPS